MKGFLELADEKLNEDVPPEERALNELTLQAQFLAILLRPHPPATQKRAVMLMRDIHLIRDAQTMALISFLGLKND